MSNAPKRQGTAWERRVADYATQHGLPWDRAPLRGTRDLLDIQGCLPAGLLVECKALSPRAEAVRAGSGTSGLSQRLSDGVGKFPAAMRNLQELTGGAAGVVPFVVVQRPRLPTGLAYAVTTLDFLLELAVERTMP